MKQVSKIMITVAILAMTASALAQNNNKTINIDFKDSSENTSMQMSFPLSVIESFVPQIQQALGEIQHDGTQIDFRQIWQSVKDAGPMDFVEVSSVDADVKVSTTETHLLVVVDEKQEGHHINVTVPMALGNALFDGEVIDAQAIMDALASINGDLVTITSETVNGRVWVE